MIIVVLDLDLDTLCLGMLAACYLLLARKNNITVDAKTFGLLKFKLLLFLTIWQKEQFENFIIQPFCLFLGINCSYEYTFGHFFK